TSFDHNARPHVEACSASSHELRRNAMRTVLQVAVLGGLSAISLAGFVGCGASSESQNKATTARGGKMGGRSAQGDKMGDNMMSADKMGMDKMGMDKMGGDKMGGDKMGMDKMATDKMSGDKMNSKMAKDQSP